MRRCGPGSGWCTTRSDNHAHFLVEADDKPSLANGMKSLGARFARCVNRVCRRTGRVLATRFHHVVFVRAAERAQALPGASWAEAAGGAGRGELGERARQGALV